MDVYKASSQTSDLYFYLFVLYAYLRVLLGKKIKCVSDNGSENVGKGRQTYFF